MTLIVDANGPESSRPGLTKVLQAVTAEVNAASASITEPSAAANGHDQEDAPVASMAQDFAPPTDPERMRRLTNLTGQTIRQACADAGKAVMKLVDDAEQELEDVIAEKRAELAEARRFAEQFNEAVNIRGAAQASGIEEMLTGLSTVHAITATVRKQVADLTAGYSQQQENRAA